MPKRRASHQRSRPTAPPAPPQLPWRFIAAFLAANVLLSAWFLDLIPTPNTTSRVLPVMAWFESGTYAIDRHADQTMDKSFVNGHYYSDKAPLSSWAVLPIYGALRGAGLVDAGVYPWRPIAAIGIAVCGVLPFVAVLWLTFARLRDEAPASHAVALAMLPLYGSFIGAYSGVYMGHVLAGALVCASYALVRARRWPALSGALAGLAVLAEYPTALAVPIWLVAWWRVSRVSAAWFVAGGLPAAIALVLYNHAITGSFFTTPYAFEAHSAFAAMQTSYGLRLPQLLAMWGLLFPPFRGAFFYAPALVTVSLAYLVLRAPTRIRHDLGDPLALFIGLSFLLFSSYFVWWGGWSYGPRHLIPAAMLALYAGLPLVAEPAARGWRGWTLTLSAAGVLMVWVSKSTSLYIMPEQYRNPVFDIAVPSFAEGRLRGDTLPALWFGLPAAASAWLWLPLFAAAVVAFSVWYRRLTPHSGRPG